MDFRMTIRDKKGTLSMRGEASIEHIESIRTELKEAIDEADITRLILVLKDVEKADLSFLQILRATRLYCQEKDIYFDLLKSNISTPLDDLISTCGLSGELLNTAGS